MAEQIEATLDALAAKLTADLPAKLDAINTERADAYPVDHPAIVLAGADNAHDYPQVFVLPDETANEMDTGGRVLWTHSIRVVSFVADWDTLALSKKLLRYQQGVREVCLEGRRPGLTQGEGGWGIEHVRDEYGPVFQPTDEEGAQMPFVQGAASLFRVRQEQTIT